MPIKIGTEFDFWKQRWQQDIDNANRKINFLKGVTHGSLAIVTLNIKGEDQIKCSISLEAVNDTELYGEPIALDGTARSLLHSKSDLNSRITVSGKQTDFWFSLLWKEIVSVEIIQKKDLPLLIGYEKKYPLFDRLLKGVTNA